MNRKKQNDPIYYFKESSEEISKNKNKTNYNYFQKTSKKAEYKTFFPNEQKIQSQISHLSHASTNAHSKKPSLSLSKNSKNNKELNNMEQIYYSFNKEEKEEINLEDNFSESLNQYTSIIKKNSENIKKLENQVNKLEYEIKEIIKNLEEEDNSNGNKNIINEKKKSNNYVSGVGDISISVPKIICKDLSMTNDI